MKLIDSVNGRRLLFLAIAVAVVAGAVGFDVWKHRSDNQPHVTAVTPTERSRAEMPGAQPELLAITDSVALASNGNENAPGYPMIVAEEMGWSVVLDAVSGRGFLPAMVAGFTVAPFSEHLPSLVKQHPNPGFVIVDGGRNDVGKPQSEAFAAMNQFYDAVRKAFPDVKLFAVVPLRMTAQLVGDGSVATYEAWAAEVRKAAERVGAHVIDSRAEHWYDGVDVGPMLWSDGIHLNGQGQRFYADKMVADMKAALA